MTILLGIVGFHFLVMIRAKLKIYDRPPYITTFILTAMMVAYVVFMLYRMEPPVNLLQ